MSEYRIALGAVGATFVLLVIGGLVHATGSSLACPDWPLCYGQVFPAMKGGILFEHGHRLAAFAVVVLTAALVWRVFTRRRDDPAVKRLAVTAMGLVLVQALLGGLTVIFKLPLLVSAAHLATSMAFFSTLIYLAWRLRPAELPRAGAGPRAAVGVAAAATYFQIVLGAFVRHTGAAMACTVRLPLCDGQLWPPPGPAQLHMLHRLFGVVLTVMVFAATLGPARAASRERHAARAVLAWGAPVLVVLQIALGLLTVATNVSVPVVAVHLALGALLLADLLSLFLSLSAPAPATRQVAGLSPATG